MDAGKPSVALCVNPAGVPAAPPCVCVPQYLPCAGGCAQRKCTSLPPFTSPSLAEWNIIYDKLAKCAESGAKIVLSRYAIGDLATQYFADRDIFCAGRVRSFVVILRLFVGCHGEGALATSSACAVCLGINAHQFN